MKTTILFSFIFLATISLSQSLTGTDSLPEYSSDPVSVYTKDYMRKYNTMKRYIVKVYPYALHAADMLDIINNNMASIEKRRKQNHYLKESYQDLKDEFKYAFYELYTQEGIMLMKLVHRETGLTVYEIAEQYRGKKNAEMFELMGKIFEQNIKVKYDPIGEDKIAEHVIQDIQSGLIPFSNEFIVLTKEEYNVEQQKDKDRKKANKDQRKTNEKLKKQKEKDKRKSS